MFDTQRIENMKLMLLGAALSFWFVFGAWDVSKANIPAIILTVMWVLFAIWHWRATRTETETNG